MYSKNGAWLCIYKPSRSWVLTAYVRELLLLLNDGCTTSWILSKLKELLKQVNATISN